MNTIENYNILEPCGCDDSALIENLPEGELDERDFNCGNILSKKIKEKIILRFSEDAPERIKIYDFVNNTMSFLIVSDRVKAVLESENVADIECLPVQLLDHNGKVASDSHNIINFIKPQPIIDMDKSEYNLSYINPLFISDIKLLKLNLDKVDQEAQLFRSTTEIFTNFITDNLLYALEKENITGIKTIPAESWDGNTLSFI